MPASFTCDGQLLRLVLTAKPDWSETLRVFESGLRDPAFLPGSTRLLVDARELDAAPTAYRLRRIADHLGRHAPGFDGIGVLVGDPLRYGLARMLGSFAEAQGARVRVFDSPETAERWAAPRDAGDDPRGRTGAARTPRTPRAEP